MSNAKHGYGTTLTWNGVTVAELTSIGTPEISMDTVEVTNHQSADAYKEYIAGLLDAGEISVEGNFDYTDTTGQQAILTDMNARTSRTVVITFPATTGTTFTFTALATRFKVGDAPVDGKIPFSASFKPTGKPTFAVATVTGMSACGFSNDVLMMPTFAIGTYEYAVTITNGETSTIVTPVDGTSGEVITITGPDGTSQVVATGVASSAITIASDELNDITIVISKTNYAPKTYVFHCAVLAA